MKIRRVLVTLFMLIPFCLSITVTAFADVPLELAPGPLFALWACGLAKKFTDNRVDYVQSMTGDEFYEWYNGKGGIEADLWRNFNRIYSLENKYGSDHPLPGTIVSASIPNESEVEMEKSHYSAAFIDQSFLNYLDERTRTAINSEIRYTTLDDLHLTTNDIVSINNIDVVVRNVPEPEVVNNMGSKWTVSNAYDVYYDISRAKALNDRVSIYTGGSLPPLIYIPTDCTVYQNGTALNSGNFYIVMGDNLLYYSGITYFPNGLIGFHYYNTSSTTDTLIFETAHLKIDTNTNSTSYGLPITERRSGYGYIYADGAQLAQINRSPYEGWVMLDRIEKLCGYCIDYNGSISEAPNLPGYIPYDDDGMIVVLVPDDDDGEVVYMNPTYYYNYVNNGDIVEGDYINNYSDTTVEDVTNQYNNYINNINNSSGGGSGSGTGSGYDDSNVISRLDSIINWLRKIHDKIDIASKTEELTFIFSSEPVYIEFSDCVTDHITLFSDVQDMMDDLNVETESSGVSEILEFGGVSAAAPGESNQIKSLFGGLTINVDWYTPYRVKVRNLLKIPCWILGIVAIWRAFKSIFGIHSGGEV